MRTKVLLCAAAVAAGALSAMAQSNVYSLNVVGYVNVAIPGGGAYTMLANPLNNTGTGGNNISNLFSAIAADGDTVFRWNVDNYDFDAVQPTYVAAPPAHWSSTFNANIGEGIWYINNNNDKTNTFVGEVFQGSYTNLAGPANAGRSLVGGGSYNAVGSSAPIGGGFTNAIVGITPNDGDTIFPWDSNAYDFSAVQPTYVAAPPAHWSHLEVQIPPGVGFVYINQGSDQRWVRTFTVQ
jgi:hypothetical protein